MNLRKMFEGRTPYFVKTDKNVSEVVKYMAERNIGAVSVFTSDNQLAGIFSERDVLKRVVAADKNPSETKITEVMTSKVYVADSEEDLDDCLKRMKLLNVRHLPVFKAGIEYLGLVSLRDLLLVDLTHKDAEIQQLNSYIYNTPI